MAETHAALRKGFLRLRRKLSAASACSEKSQGMSWALSGHSLRDLRMAVKGREKSVSADSLNWQRRGTIRTIDQYKLNEFSKIWWSSVQFLWIIKTASKYDLSGFKREVWTERPKLARAISKASTTLSNVWTVLVLPSSLLAMAFKTSVPGFNSGVCIKNSVSNSTKASCGRSPYSKSVNTCSSIDLSRRMKKRGSSLQIPCQENSSLRSLQFWLIASSFNCGLSISSLAFLSQPKAGLQT